MIQSVVEEFSILYTDRLVQKDKKWADGTLKYYQFNNKVEIFNEQGILVKADFKSIKFEVDQQYRINKFLVEIIDYQGTVTRDIQLKKEPDSQRAATISGNLEVCIRKPQDPSTTSAKSTTTESLKSLTDKYTIGGTNLQRKHTILRPSNIKKVGLDRPLSKALKVGPENKSKPLRHMPSRQNTVSSSAKSNSTSLEINTIPDTPTRISSNSTRNPELKFKIVKPILKRVIPRTSKIFRYQSNYERVP